MRRSARIHLVSALSALAAGSALAQSAVDSAAVRPAVMLLVDTSGSMERAPDDGSNPDCDSCIPSCTGDTAHDSANKTRWAMTLEALTGTIQNYTCQVEDRLGPEYVGKYDYGYYLPHVNFTRNLLQLDDGILDNFENRVKFGLMTFDGVGTTIGGDTLVPYSDWLGGDPEFVARANDSPGMYSYGPIKRLSFPGCLTDYGINAGARKPGTHEGAMIRVGASDDLYEVKKVNQQVQNSLLQVRPFGGTPIAAMLDDLKFYLTDDPESDLSAAEDGFYKCRQRTGILITDGAPDALFRDTRFQCYDDGTAGELDATKKCAPDSSGSSSEPSCACPYDSPERVAERLVSAADGGIPLLKRLIVVAYNVYDEAALAILDKIGDKGVHGEDINPDKTSVHRHIVQAKGQTELRKALNDLLSTADQVISSRSVPVSVNTGDLLLGENSKRFDITAGFMRGANPDEPWSGLLYRQRVLCGDDGPEAQDMSVAEGDVIHEKLNTRTSARTLLTVVPSDPADPALQVATLINADYDPSTATISYDRTPLNEAINATTKVRDTIGVRNRKTPKGADMSLMTLVDPDNRLELNKVDKAPKTTDFDYDLAPVYFQDTNGDNRVDSVDSARIVDYVLGRSRPTVMADIYHSNPSVLVPVNKFSGSRLSSANAAYASWLRTLAIESTDSHYGPDGRPGVIFVGTNDGVLHAFNLDKWRSRSGVEYAAGEEMWGFIPPALFGKMHSMLTGHQLMFDGTPIVQDVLLQKKASGAPLFRTVLLAAVRGAAAYVALDVTYPEAPVFLWQTAFARLGDTVADPALTQVDVSWRNEVQTRAVAILPGGDGEETATCSGGHALEKDVTLAEFPESNDRNVRCWKQRGRSLYIVDVATGGVIQEFGPEHFPSPLTGSVVVDGVGTGRSSAAYFFDHDGILWRLSMLGADASEWRVQPIYDMFADPVIESGDHATPPTWAAGRHPIYAPTLSYDGFGNLVILAGTGDVDSPIDSARQRVISLTEYRNAGVDSRQLGGEVVLNWKIDLDVNEGVTGPLTVLNDVVYFATFQSSAGERDQCALGVSRIYGAHAYERNPLSSGDRDSWPPVPRPELMATGSAPGAERVLSELFDNGSSNQLMGVTVRRQPICRSSVPLINPITGQAMPASPTGGTYQLTGMLSNLSARATQEGGSKLSQLPLQPPLPDGSRQTISTWASYAE